MADIQGNIIKVDSLVKQLNQAFAAQLGLLDQVATKMSSVNNQYAKSPSAYLIAQQKEIANNKTIEKSLKEIEKERIKAQKLRVSDLKLQKKREQAFDKYERQLEREQRLLEKTQGLYNKVQRGINSVTKQYQDLAVRKELNGKLSAEEEITLGKLEAKLNKYQSALKRVDANIGKHQRNVGNYKSGFDGLGFSIAQLSRELPAFANSVQTGFMAISNNIPMLVDEITRLKQANVELAASGKPTTNIFRQVGKAIFSLNGMLGIAITALTVFAPKLFEWAFGMSEAEKATEKATEELKKQNDEIRENIRLRDQLLGKTTDLLNTIQYSEKLKAIWESGIFESEKNEAFLSELSDRLEKIGVSEAKYLRDTNLLQSDRVLIGLNLLQIEKEKQKLAKERFEIDQDATRDLNKVIAIQQRINQLQEANQRIIEKTVEIENEEGRSKASDNRLKALELEAQGINSFVLEIKKQITQLQEAEKAYAKNSKEAIYLRSQIEALEKALDPLDDAFKDSLNGVNDWSEAFKRGQKIMKDLQKSTETFISSFSSDFISQNPFSELMKFADGSFDLLLEGADTAEEKFAVMFNGITEAAQQTFNVLNSLTQENFTQQYESLERQKEIALQFAGESVTAREEIERQYEEKRKSIQRREAKAQKDLALFNIGINTAQAVVATLAKTPPPAGLPLAALVAALGAAQAAVVASQTIPQFWEGGIVGGSQQIMVNDDPYGKKGANYKEVVRKPNGQTLFPQGKNVKMTVPKGTEIFPTYDAFMSTLNTELGLNGIGLSTIQPNVNVNGGITESQIRSVMAEHGKSVVNAINNKTEYHVNWDENGMNKYIVKGNTKREVLNARFRGRGRSV